MIQKLSSCGQRVRAQDPDRFLLSMFAPADRRKALWALFDFNLEIAKTRSVVSDTQLGLIRLQWWREAIGGLYEGRASGHEVLGPLAEAIRAFDLPRPLFETLIYAREFDLEGVLPSNMDGFLNYADFTSAPLWELAMRIAGEYAEAEPVRPVAINYALAGLLRAVPYLAAQGRCMLPEDLLAAHGVNLAALYRGQPGEGLGFVVRAVWEQRIEGLRSESRFLRAVNGLAGMYLAQIRARRFDVFSPKLAVAPPFAALRLLFSVM